MRVTVLQSYLGPTSVSPFQRALGPWLPATSVYRPRQRQRTWDIGTDGIRWADKVLKAIAMLIGPLEKLWQGIKVREGWLGSPINLWTFWIPLTIRWISIAMSCLVVNTFQGLPRKEKKRKAEEAAEEPAAKEVKVVPPQDTKRWVGWSTQIREKHGKSTKILRIYVFQLCFIVYIYIYCIVVCVCIFSWKIRRGPASMFTGVWLCMLVQPRLKVGKFWLWMWVSVKVREVDDFWMW